AQKWSRAGTCRFVHAQSMALAAVPRVGSCVYFLRKRSSRTTSAPSPGAAGGTGFSSLASGTGAGEGAATAVGAGAAGNLGELGVSAIASDGSNCRPNWTDGSKKLLIAWKGTTSRSATPPNDK